MLTYKAMYKFVDGGVHAEVLDFPGAITCGEDLAMRGDCWPPPWSDMAETLLLAGEPLPTPDPACTDPESDLEEPIHLLLTAASRVKLVPESAAP